MTVGLISGLEARKHVCVKVFLCSKRAEAVMW